MQPYHFEMCKCIILECGTVFVINKKKTEKTLENNQNNPEKYDINAKKSSFFANLGVFEKVFVERGVY